MNKKLLLSGITLSSIITTSAVNAAGFALREQSVYGQGSSFAGIAAGGDISTSFWNPATISDVESSELQGALNIISSDTEIETTGSSNVIYGNLDETGNIGGTAIIPNIYYGMELNDRLSWGLALTAPYGSSSEAKKGSRSQYVSLKAEASSLNFSPTIAYDVTNDLALAAGLQVQSIDLYLSRALPVGAGQGVFTAFDPTLEIEGDDTAIGFTLGAQYQTGNTSLGLGYRSGIEHDMNGSLKVDALGINADVNLELELPSMITLGLKQQINDKLSLGFTFEKADWSSVGTLLVKSNATGQVATIAGNPVAIPLNYQDTNFYSIGGDYQYSDTLTLRSGLGLDETTVTDLTRTTQLPDNDRYWLSFGFSKTFDSLTLDAGYTYVKVNEVAEVNIVPGHASYNGLPYTGKSQPSVHILAFSLTKQL